MTRVAIMKRSGRPYFEAQWRDPVTERKKTKSLGTADRREAQREAARLELEIAAGRRPTNTTWRDAVELYQAEVFPRLAPDSRSKIRSTFRLIDQVISPARIAGLNEPQLARLVSDLRARDRSEATVRGHLRNCRAFLRWAFDRRILERVPTMPALGRAAPGMKGRPITAEELDRLLVTVPAVVGEDCAPAWQHLLRGLWLTGLRLGEALNLDWQDDSRLAVELDGKYPFFRIQGRAEKGRKFRLLPMTPEAGEFFRETPPADRRGRVFRPVNPQDGNRPALHWASKLITRIGKEARVAVSEPKPRRSTKELEPKWASAHDLRRAFGFRLSNRVRAPLLMQLMRHSSINTTLQFYVGADATAAARELWREMQPAANVSANVLHSDHGDASRERPETTGIPGDTE